MSRWGSESPLYSLLIRLSGFVSLSTQLLFDSIHFLDTPFKVPFSKLLIISGSSFAVRSSAAVESGLYWRIYSPFP
jgi:hypothetical protein